MEVNTPISPEEYGSERRRELLDLAVEYVSEHGTASSSLRPMAAAIGSSPRVLLYLFGSKQELFIEIFSVCRSRQVRLLEEARDAASTPEGAVWHLWKSWLADPQRESVMRLFFDNYVQSLYGESPYTVFAPSSVEQWLGILEGMFADRPQPREAATQVLAMLRGLLLDTLATGESARADQALWNYLRLGGTAEGA